ncbi:hypothetical protein D3C80_1734790 [compost metagenome]
MAPLRLAVERNLELDMGASLPGGKHAPLRVDQGEFDDFRRELAPPCDAKGEQIVLNAHFISLLSGCRSPIGNGQSEPNRTLSSPKVSCASASNASLWAMLST